MSFCITPEINTTFYLLNGETNGGAIVRSQIDGDDLADGGQTHLLDIVIMYVLEPVGNTRIPGGVAPVAMEVLTVTRHRCRRGQRTQGVGGQRQPSGAEDAIKHEKCQRVDRVNAVLHAFREKRLPLTRGR